MDIWARLRSFEEYFDGENESIVPHLVIWSLFVTASAIVLSTIAGNPLGTAVPVGLVSGAVTFTVVGVAFYAWRSVNSDTATEE